MSRIGKTPIEIPQDVNVTINGSLITVKGKKGELTYTMLNGISAEVNDNMIKIKRADDSKALRAYHGLTRSLVQNMVTGVSKGFEKILQVIGTGYGAEVIGPWLKLVLGYSHDIYIEIPEHIEVKTETIPRRDQGKLGVQAIIKISGINKEDVGKFAAEVRRCREPENYKGKGIRYEGEYVQIKAGKTGAA